MPGGGGGGGTLPPKQRRASATMRRGSVDVQALMKPKFDYNKFNHTAEYMMVGLPQMRGSVLNHLKKKYNKQMFQEAKV